VLLAPSSHPPSYSSSAAAWTNCGQLRQHTIHTLPRSTGTLRNRPMYFYGRTPYAVPWTHHSASRTDKTFEIIVAAGRSPFQQIVSSMRRFWTGRGTSLATPAAHQPNHKALKPQQSHHQFGPHAPIPAFNTFSLLCRKVMWELRTCSETARPTLSPTTNRWSSSLQLLPVLTANQSNSSFYSFRNSGIKVYYLP